VFGAAQTLARHDGLGRVFAGVVHTVDAQGELEGGALHDDQFLIDDRDDVLHAEAKCQIEDEHGLAPELEALADVGGSGGESLRRR
jgi:hypothetical protein